MGLDQYYTNPEIAKYCYSLVKQKYPSSGHIYLEPSAGSGSFLDLMPEGSLAFDLDPKHPNVVCADFLEVDLSKHQNLITVGNPPFGKNASLAVKFFNKCAAASAVIAFIVPRTFRKPSIINRLDDSFHCVHDEVLPKDSFLFLGEPYDVPCVFQIWERCADKRPRIITRTTHPDFMFTTADQAEFAIQRVGVKAGTIKTDLTLSAQSHYFIKPNNRDVERVMRTLDFTEVKFDTAGNPSISKDEVIRLYEQALRP